MKVVSAVFITCSALILLTSCASNTQNPTHMASNFIKRQQVTTTTPDSYPASNPQKVAFYDNSQKPLTPYRIIGVASVSKYNLLGMPRGEETMNTMIKQLAASIGGEGIINVSRSPDKVEGKVIVFQKILL